MAIQPLGDRILIQQLESEERTAGGLYIPDNAKEKPQEATVIAVGPGNKENEVTLKVGDKVLYGKYAGTEVKHGGEEYIIISESEILAKIN